MFVLTLSYLIPALAGLVALAVMILRIGALMADCPKNGPTVRVSAITITTGFVAIGAGGVILIAALLPLFQGEGAIALALCLGLASLCLGLGFTQAVATLRAVLDDLNRPDLQAPAEAPPGD